MPLFNALVASPLPDCADRAAADLSDWHVCGLPRALAHAARDPGFAGTLGQHLKLLHAEYAEPALAELDECSASGRRGSRQVAGPCALAFAHHCVLQRHLIAAGIISACAILARWPLPRSGRDYVAWLLHDGRVVALAGGHQKAPLGRQWTATLRTQSSATAALATTVAKAMPRPGFGESWLQLGPAEAAARTWRQLDSWLGHRPPRWRQTDVLGPWLHHQAVAWTAFAGPPQSPGLAWASYYLELLHQTCRAAHQGTAGLVADAMVVELGFLLGLASWAVPAGGDFRCDPFAERVLPVAGSRIAQRLARGRRRCLAHWAIDGDGRLPFGPCGVPPAAIADDLGRLASSLVPESPRPTARMVRADTASR